MYQVHDDNHLYYNGSEGKIVRQVPGVVTHYDAEKYQNTCELVVVHALGELGGVPTAHSHAMDPRFDSSWHITINREGLVYQLLPFMVCAFHAGTSEYKHRKRLNKYSIGIELENYGPLQVDDWSRLIAATPFGPRSVPSSDAQLVDGEWWHTYTDAQLGASVAVVKALRSKYDIWDVIGHSMCSTTKRDPGPLLDIQWLEQASRPPSLD